MIQKKIPSAIFTAAKTIWDYHLLHHTIEKSDLILVLGSDDPRVAQRGIELYQKGLAPKILFSGGEGELTKGLYGMSEADYFAQIALTAKIPPHDILIENHSTNTGENITLSAKVIQARRIPFDTVILVQKPFMERRTLAVFRNYFPTLPCCVTSPQIKFENYPSPTFPFNHLVNIMVGDLQRIREYPKLGFQIPQPMEDKVWKAALFLIDQGFSTHLIPEKQGVGQ